MSNEKVLCDGCQQWGCDPIIVNGVCETCNRTSDEIKNEHGVVMLKDRDKRILQHIIQSGVQDLTPFSNEDGEIWLK